MAYQIMRIAKLKTPGKIAAAFNHNLREKTVPNADPKKARLNQIEGPLTVAAARERWEELLPEKRRKDAVTLTEAVITASPGAFSRDDEWAAYLRDGVQFFKEKHGAENVISVAYHWDEATPHAHVLAVPMVDGRLSQKKLYGSSKKDLANLQSAFHEKVSRHYGLERGVARSTARHQDVRRYYGHVEQERETKKNVLAKAQQERAATEYHVRRDQKLTDRISELESERNGLRIERDTLKAERDQARGEVEQAKEVAHEWATEYWRLTAHVRGVVDKKITVDWKARIAEWEKHPEHRTQMTRLNDEIRRQQSRERGIER